MSNNHSSEGADIKEIPLQDIPAWMKFPYRIIFIGESISLLGCSGV
ncbi:MAG: hypothetical protein IJV22_00800 [Bacteroidales bacterium]|nr:hypothetical protein [Bacteroidales bacterium]